MRRPALLKQLSKAKLISVEASEAVFKPKKPSSSRRIHVAEDDDDDDEKQNNSTIKCCLAKSLLITDAEDKAAFVHLVTKMSDAITKMMRRGSLLLLLHTMRRMEDGRAIPTMWISGSETQTWYKRLMTLTSSSEDHPDQTLMDTFNTFRHLFPDDDVKVLSRMDQVLAYAARQFKTSVVNSLWVPFESRLKRLCSTYLRDNKREEDGAVVTKWDLINTIRRGIPWGSVAPESKAMEFAAQVRSWLLPEEQAQFISDGWVKTKTVDRRMALLNFNFQAGASMRAMGGRGVALMPVFTAQRKHITLDVKSTLMLLHDVGFVDYNALEEAGLSSMKEVWLSFFDVGVLLGHAKRKDVRTCLRTDGTSASFTFTKSAEKAPASSERHLPWHRPWRHEPGLRIIVDHSGGVWQAVAVDADAQAVPSNRGDVRGGPEAAPMGTRGRNGGVVLEAVRGQLDGGHCSSDQVPRGVGARERPDLATHLEEEGGASQVPAIQRQARRARQLLPIHAA